MMNLGFLILIVIPLGLYLIVLIWSSRDFSPDGKSAALAAEAIAPPTPEAIQEAAIVSAIEATTSSDEPAVAAQDTSESGAETRTAEPFVETAPAQIAAAAVVVQEIREPAAETIEAAPGPIDPITAVVQEQVSPATQEAAVKPPSPATPPQAGQDDPSQPILSGQPLILPGDSPKYAFDYRGRLWVEKKRRGFFRQLRRPQLPPEDPSKPPDR